MNDVPMADSAQTQHATPGTSFESRLAQLVSATEARPPTTDSPLSAIELMYRATINNGNSPQSNALLRAAMWSDGDDNDEAGIPDPDDMSMDSDDPDYTDTDTWADHDDSILSAFTTESTERRAASRHRRTASSRSLFERATSDARTPNSFYGNSDELLRYANYDLTDLPVIPGLFGDRPLNPSPPDPSLARGDNVFPAFVPKDPIAASDPSSSLSPTSFLQPGVVFVGHQSFESKQRQQTRAANSHRSAFDPISFMPYSDRSNGLLPPSDFPALPGRSGLRDRPVWEAEPDGGGAVGPGPSLLEQHLSRSYRRMHHRPSHDSAPWRAHRPTADDDDGEDGKQQWGVRVILHSVSPENRSITGLMHAVGVPASSEDITTFFSGELVSVSETGLRTKKIGPTKPMTELEYWSRIGPFRGLSFEQLATRMNDTAWLEEVSRGWVLMRWKEVDFVNVKPSACSLSIDGFYLVALDRSTGELEGLYCDPSTPPYQRLMLSPAASSAPFALGTYVLS